MAEHNRQQFCRRKRAAVGSIRDYYVDPNLTEEDRAVPNSHDGWMDVKVRNSNSRFMIEIVFNTCLPLYL